MFNLKLWRKEPLRWMERIHLYRFYFMCLTLLRFCFQDNAFVKKVLKIQNQRTKPVWNLQFSLDSSHLTVFSPCSRQSASSTSAERKFAISFEEKSACNRRSRSTRTVQETRATDSAHICCPAAESTLNCKKWFPSAPKANSGFPFRFENKLRTFRNVNILPWSPLFNMPRILFFWRKMKSY